MRHPLAIDSRAPEVSRPDISWMKKYVPILAIARCLGLTVRRGKAKCWRIANHRHGDVDPSLRFVERRNRYRCFVCDMRGGHSNVDLVMGVLDCDLASESVGLPKSQWTRGIRTKYVLRSKPLEVAPSEDWFEKLKGRKRPSVEPLPDFELKP